MELTDLRTPYEEHPLNESDVDPNPFKQFERWLQEAIEAKQPEANAMALATATYKAVPSVRMVLLKQFSEEGLIFFTNLDSRKTIQIVENPQVAVVFHWQVLARNVRVEGKVRAVDPKVSDAYFKTRPRGSRIGAWASPQSEIIQSREELERRVAEIEKKYADQEDIPRPYFWGGYQIIPNAFEFWQGRSNQLHDRLRYTRNEADWKIERLAP